MKKVFFIFVLLLFFFSCKSAPETSLGEIPEEAENQISDSSQEEIADETILPEQKNEVSSEDYSLPVEEPASVIVPDNEPSVDADYQNELLEPMEPEIKRPKESIDEDTVESPIIEQEPEDIQTIVQESETSVPEMQPEPPFSPETVPVEQEQLPPNVPDFLRPAEPLEDLNIIRESVPVPINSIPELPAQIVPPIEKENIVFSRTVRAAVGQIIEIPFRGTGWVFLGETSSQKGITYDSRRLDTDGQSFIFHTEESGTYILKFYKEDYIRDYILNDHVQVIIEEAPEPSGTGWFNPPSDWSRVVAEPRWPLESGSTQIPDNTTQESPTENILPENAASISDEGIVPVTSVQAPSEDIPETPDDEFSVIMPENAAPEDYLKKAREEFDADRIMQALSILEQFKQRYPSGSDEVFWLLGQIYEANSPIRDIRTSLDYYRRLTDEYPQSMRYAAARARIAYLERYYLNIR
jgi:hypothetical protein